MTNRYSMKLLPPYLAVNEQARELDPPFYEITEDGFLRHETDYLYDTMTKYYRNTLFDFDGNVTETKEYTSESWNFGRSIYRKNDILFSRATASGGSGAETYKLEKPDGTPPSEYTAENGFGADLKNREAGGYYFFLRFMISGFSTVR